MAGGRFGTTPTGGPDLTRSTAHAVGETWVLCPIWGPPIVVLKSPKWGVGSCREGDSPAHWGSGLARLTGKGGGHEAAEAARNCRWLASRAGVGWRRSLEGLRDTLQRKHAQLDAGLASSWRFRLSPPGIGRPAGSPARVRYRRGRCPLRVPPALASVGARSARPVSRSPAGTRARRPGR